MGTDYFGNIDHSLRDCRLKFGDRLAGTLEHLENVKVNLSMLDPHARKLLLGRMGDEVAYLKRDAQYKPIIDEDGNFTVQWLLVQKRVNRLVNSDNFLYDPDYCGGVLEEVIRAEGLDGGKRIIDELFVLLKEDAYPRGVYPKEIKFSSFGYIAGRMVLLDVDLGRSEASFENVFSTGILDILDPTGKLSNYYRAKLSSEPERVNMVPVMVEDIDFVVDGVDTETAQRRLIRELLVERQQSPLYTISREVNERTASGETAYSVIEKIFARHGISLRTGKGVDIHSPYLRVIAEAFSLLPTRVFSGMTETDFSAISFTQGAVDGALIRYNSGILYIAASALKVLGEDKFLFELHRCIGEIFLSTLQEGDIEILSRYYGAIKMRGQVIKAASAESGYDFIEAGEGEEFTEYLSRMFAYYVVNGDKFRQVVNGDIAYAYPYDTIRPGVRRIYDLFKFAFDWKEYNSVELFGLKNALEQARRDSLSTDATLVDLDLAESIFAFRQTIYDAIEWMPGALHAREHRYGLATVFLTRYCNMSCLICVADSPLLPKDPLQVDPNMSISEEKVAELIKFLNDGEFSFLTLMGGGEPLLNDESIDMAIKIISETNAKFIEFQTNGIWAQDIDKAREILRRIDMAFKESSPAEKSKKLRFSFSIDEFHDTRGLEGVVNLLELIVQTKGMLFPESNAVPSILFHVPRSRNIKPVYQKLKAMLAERLNGADLDLSEFSQSLESGNNSPRSGFGNMMLTTTDGAKCKLRYELTSIFSCPRIKRGIAAGTIKAEDIIPYQHDLLSLDGTYGKVIINPWTQLYEVALDVDGMVSLSCRFDKDNIGLVSGNVSDGLEVIRERESKDPIFATMREPGTLRIVELLKEIDPDSLEGADEFAQPYDTLDEVLSDETLRIRLMFALLKQDYWYKLTPESREKISNIEAEFEASLAERAAKRVPELVVFEANVAGWLKGVHAIDCAA